MSQKEDIKLGAINENKVFPTLSSFFNTDLKKTPNKFNLFDWTNTTNTIFVELKSRRISYNKYDTTIIGLNKIKTCTNPNVCYYFVFLFTDGLYYIKYDKDIFSKFKIEDMQISLRYDVDRIEINRNVKIPISLLEKIPNTILFS
jgi:hypothetical protein